MPSVTPRKWEVWPIESLNWRGIWVCKFPPRNPVHLIWWFEATSLSSPYQQQTLERDGRHLASPRAQFYTSNACAVTHGPPALSLLTHTHTHTHAHAHTHTHTHTHTQSKDHTNESLHMPPCMYMSAHARAQFAPHSKVKIWYYNFPQKEVTCWMALQIPVKCWERVYKLLTAAGTHTHTHTRTLTFPRKQRSHNLL